MNSKENSVWLADYSWTEVEKKLEQGFATLLLMLGATEQHGPHLPLATDTVIAEAVAKNLAIRLGKTLIAPIVPIGTSDEHMDFCGTLSTSKETLAGLIADIGRSAANHGFQRLLVLTMHGGNYDAIRLGVNRLRSETQTLQVIAFTELVQALQATAKTHLNDLSENVAGLHAGERETSQMLYLRPELVQMAHAESGYVGDMRAILPRLMQVGLRPVTANGVLGDPTLATAARGQIYLAEFIEALATAIELNFGQGA